MKEELYKAIDWCLRTHKDAHRTWDGNTPYAVHPLWCALTFLQETNLPEEIDRETCALALLMHDGPEDTGQPLPDWVPPKVVNLVSLMTFSSEPGSTEIERKEIWKQAPLMRLLKLYDKTSNYLDGTWMPVEKRQVYAQYILELTADVKQNFGDLNIIKIAQAIVKESK